MDCITKSIEIHVIQFWTLTGCPLNLETIMNFFIKSGKATLHDILIPDGVHRNKLIWDFL